MKNLIVIVVLGFLVSACTGDKEVSSINPENWKKRTIGYSLPDSLTSGSTYLSVYSQIYGMTEHRTYDLTATISMRNTNRSDSIFLLKAEYYNTEGELIRTYFNKPVFLAPMETVEIVIDEVDQEGGTGANFMFDWKIHPESNEPYFECVMISTSGQQGLSFSTKGVNVNID
jgi:hypothetical protein